MLNIQELQPEYITDVSGKKKSVVLSVSSFKELMENIEDLAAAAERREEDTVSHDALLEELRRDGLL